MTVVIWQALSIIEHPPSDDVSYRSGNMLEMLVMYDHVIIGLFNLCTHSSVVGFPSELRVL